MDLWAFKAMKIGFKLVFLWFICAIVFWFTFSLSAVLISGIIAFIILFFGISMFKLIFHNKILIWAVVIIIGIVLIVNVLPQIKLPSKVISSQNNVPDNTMPSNENNPPEIKKIVVEDNKTNTQKVIFVPCQNVTKYKPEVYLYKDGTEIGRGYLNSSVVVNVESYVAKLTNKLSIPVSVKGSYTLTSNWFGYNFPREFELTAEPNGQSSYSDPNAENCRLGSCQFTDFKYELSNKDISEEVKQIPYIEEVCGSV